MLFQIGHREERRLDDVVGPLLDCHTRIRAFSSIARRIAAGHGSPEQIAAAAARVERYFRVAYPLHLADEEVSLRPRLLVAPVDPEVIVALEAMTEEHEAIEALLADLLPRWETLAASPSELLGLAPALAEDSAVLEQRFAAHLEREERALFPVVAARLGAEAPAIRAEMVLRREGAHASPT